MACERFHAELMDVAAGQPAAAGTSAHLESCPSCRAELAALQRGLALADRTLEEIALAEPSPRLRARIRQAGATEAAPHRPWRWAWMAAAVALITAVGLTVLWRGGRTATPRQRSLVALASPSPSAVAEMPGRRSVEPEVTTSGRASTAGPPSAAQRRLSAPARRPPEPEVLVQPGQQEALVRFVALVQANQVTPRTFASTGVASADLAELVPLEIKPLEIVPLDPAETPGT